ncbi:hypothetical protein AAEX63_08225 [Luteococcus sp. H138]|uniref:hypothetical protein n=1 Tax=unclassified Luteococcus TaxID=2639923 RepID=UPI00313E346D
MSNPSQIRRVVGVLALAAAVLTLTACGGSTALPGEPGGPPAPTSAPPPVVQTTGVSPSAATPTGSGTPVVVIPSATSASATASGSGDSGSSAPRGSASGNHPAALVSSFPSLQARLSGPAGVAIVPVGGAGKPVVLGKLQTGAAWSTAKVPLAIAALGSAASASSGDVRRAIIASDNEAADRLWHRIGGGQQAASAVDKVLRAGGDAVTLTQPAVVRPPYSAFGQTSWALTNQASFAAHLPCMASGTQVLGLMRQVDGGQQWGLYRLGGAAIKGGWGPSSGSGYLVRQLGVLPVEGGQLGVAIMVDSPGGFESGVRDLNVITDWLQANRAALPAGGNC